MRKSIIYIILLFNILTGCGSGNNSGVKNEVVVVAEKRKFVLPEVPTILSPKDKGLYLIDHFWDNFNFADTTLISDSEFTERALAEHITLIKRANSAKSNNALKTLMRRASVDSAMLHHFINITEKYLYNPNSPLRDGELYISVLEGIIELPNLDEIYKIRPKYQLNLEKKNRVGELATNFKYTLASGATSTIYAVKSKYTILYFSNPDCTECARVKQYIMDTPLFNGNKELQIISIYPDKDLTIWQDAVNTFPKEWINGYDKGVVSDNSLYDLRAIPTLYLLDKDKRVILKDATIEQIHNYLQKIILSLQIQKK